METGILLTTIVFSVLLWICLGGLGETVFELLGVQVDGLGSSKPSTIYILLGPITLIASLIYLVILIIVYIAIKIKNLIKMLG